MNFKRRQSACSFAKGFSLTEILVALAVFSLISVVIAGSFARFIGSYTRAKKIETGFENAQFLMNVMAKTIRTSQVQGDGSGNVDFSGNALKLYDYSQASAPCIMYIYDGVNDVIKWGASSASGSDISTCNFGAIASSAVAIGSGGDIVNMQVAGTVSQGSSKGKVTVLLDIKEPGQSSGNLVQMSVSLRD